MPRKKSPNPNEQFNCRIAPAVLKEARELADSKNVRLGEIIEQALVRYLKLKANQ